jgi:4-amino-4-deoxy-L-arabinose transferase-like glycosyltransferase
MTMSALGHPFELWREPCLPGCRHGHRGLSVNAPNDVAAAFARVVGGTAAGLIELVRRRRERGFVLLRVWLVFVLIPYSLMAAKFIRYALPLFAAVDLVAAIGVITGIGWLLRKRWLSPVTRVAVSLLAIVVCIVALAVGLQSAPPFYSLFRNAVGERIAAAGETFPEEAYDYGVREAVAAIARTAGTARWQALLNPAMLPWARRDYRTGPCTDSGHLSSWGAVTPAS